MVHRHGVSGAGMKRLTLIMPYYDNPGMLAIHYRTWAAYPDDLRERLRVIIVDDGSPGVAAAEVDRPEGLPDLRIYRVTVDLPWHQHAARNIGAFHARKGWMLMTDIDHLLPEGTLRTIIGIPERTRTDEAFTFTRVDAPDMAPTVHAVTGKPKPHVNTFVIHRDLYWQLGGYDEDYCGVYGTDGYFRKRLWAVARQTVLPTPLIRYAREVQPDASTRTLPRKEGRVGGEKRAVEEKKRAWGRVGKIASMTMPYLRAHP